MKPRFYQREAGDALVKTLFDTPGEQPLVAMPTGTGKSISIAYACKEIIDRVPSARLAVATHSQELVEQDAKTMSRYWQAAPYGILASGLGLRQTAMPITFCSIQTLARNPKALGRLSGVLVDEAHAIAPGENTMYQKTFDALRELNENMFIGGFTATPFRLGQGMLMDGNVFTKMAYDVTGRKAFVKFIDMGYLCPLVPKRTSFQFDISKVHMVAGDLNQRELQEACNVDELTYNALQETLQVGHDRQHIMVFCAGIDHVHAVTSMLQAFGEDVVNVHSKMKRSKDPEQDERVQAIKAFRTGRARWIVNDGILTTGVDFPHVDCIVLLRPTASPGLHVQILGRGTRCDYQLPQGAEHWHPEAVIEWLDVQENRLAAIEASAKHNCLVLDFSGNTERCGPINDPRIPKKKGPGTGEVPVKLCPKCDTYVHAAARFCDGITWEGKTCGYEFQFETHLEQTAATTELIVRDDAPPEMHWFKVDRVEYKVINKPFTPAMMQVEYFTGLRRFTQLVCVEHQSYAGKVARDWWRERLPGYPPPPSTLEGMTAVNMLRVPTNIYVHTNTKRPKITAVSFDGTTPEYNPNAKTT